MVTYKLENVSKSFGNKKDKFYALKNISLIFQSRGLTFIAGKSGSGKSTLLNILMGIEKISEGKIFYEHKKFSSFNEKRLSQFHLYEVSMIYQHYNLFNGLTAIENAIIPLLVKGESQSDAFKQAKAMFEEFNIDDLASQKVDTLSGGERQRVAIIRALLTKPKVLLCDEPTGALDSKNAEEIMKIIQKLSKKILVIMVSHNIHQIEKYADRVITLKDGQVVSDTNPFSHTKDYEPERKKHKYSSKWKKLFFFSHLKEHLKKNIFSFFVLCFGFVTSLLSVGFISSSSKSLDNLLFQSLNSCSAKVSDESIIKIENSPLNFIKVVRPDLSKIDENLYDIPSLKVMNNYEYLFSNYPEATFHKSVIDSPTLVPIYSFIDNEIISNLIVEGSIPTFDSIEDVVVNEEFVKTLNISNKDAINQEVIVSSIREISVPTDSLDTPIIKESFSYTLSLSIRGVIKEFGFLNSPKIYYSNLALEKYLAQRSMQNYSSYLGENISYKSYFESLGDNDQTTSYSYHLFVDNIKDIQRLYDKFNILKDESESLTIDSSYYESYSSYRSLLDTFSIALLVFTIICFLGINFILGMLSLSSFIEKKKESAILSCLGARSFDISSLFLDEVHLILFASFISSIGLTIPLQNLLNQIFENHYGLSHLFDIPYQSFYNIPFLIPVGMLIIFFVISSLFVLVPITIYKSNSLTEELRDE